MMISFWKTKGKKLKRVKTRDLNRVAKGVCYEMDTWKYSSHPFVVRACLSAMVTHQLIHRTYRIIPSTPISFISLSLLLTLAQLYVINRTLMRLVVKAITVKTHETKYRQSNTLMLDQH